MVVSQWADRLHFALGPEVFSLDGVCPANGTMKGAFACDGGAVARRVAEYNVSGAEEVRRLSSVSTCDFEHVSTFAWPPKKPALLSSGPAGSWKC
eukprot:Skav225191  [mRNA]  locus=scaffold3065:60339:72084:+ [translate_table: standard]